MSIAPPIGKSHVAVQHDEGVNEFCERIRLVLVKRKEQKLGLIISKRSPPTVAGVVEASPGEAAGLKNGDQILAVNGIDLRDLPPEKADNLIQGSGSMPSLIIQSATGSLPHPVSSLNPQHRASCELLNDQQTEPPSASSRRRQSHANIKAFSTSWTSAFVPDYVTFEKQSFKEQIENLLTGDENETIKNAFIDFSRDRNIDIMLFALYPILGAEEKMSLWQFVIFCLTPNEEKLFRKRLFDLVNIQLPKETFKRISVAWNNAESIQKSSVCGTVETNDQAESAAFQTASSADPKSDECGDPERSDHGLSPVVVRRERRRRTERKKLDLALCHQSDQIPIEPQLNRQPPELISKSPLDSIRRRGQRERNLTRRRSLADNYLQNINEQSKQSGENNSSPKLTNRKFFLDLNIKPNTISHEEKPSSDVTDQSKLGYVDPCFGDKKKKQKSEVSTSLPRSAIDDVVKETKKEKGSSQRKSSASGQLKPTHRQTDARESKSGVPNDEPNQRKTSKSGINGDPLGLEVQKSGFSRSPEFEGIFLDRSKQKKSYFKTPFKMRPSKPTDTDTFLSEISTQVDPDLNVLLDDLVIADDDVKKDLKFGEKWSYLPKPENDKSPITSISEDPLMEAVKALDPHGAGNSEYQEEFLKESKNRSQYNNFIRDPISEEDHDVVPPFPTDLESITTGSASFTNAAANPQELKTSTKEETNREERVRRRRRRNADPASKQNETPSRRTEAEKISARRLSVPLQLLQNDADSTRQDDAVIYDVPKPATTVAPQRRAHVNIEKRSRRSRANNRRNASLNKRNSTELRMHVWNENDLADPTDGVKLRSSSPVEQGTFYDRAKKKNFRVSGVSIAMEDIFSRAENDLYNASAPNNRPPTPLELSDASHHYSDALDLDEIYAPLQDEVLALGLAYDEQDSTDEEELPQSSEIQNVTDLSAIPSPPPPPPVIPPPPPPPPLSPPLMFKNTPPASPNRIPVKRINWEKIEPVDLTNTVWGQLGEDHETIKDAVKYMDLEEHFAMKRAKNLKQKTVEHQRNNAICLLAHKKAYNTSILLAHLKLSHRQICECLMVTGREDVRKKMDSSHYKQLLMYAPDQEEVEKLKSYNGDMSKLNEVDVLAIKLVNIPGYHLRLKALMFKHSFSERDEEIQKNLEVIQRASIQLRKSRKLAKILEFVLAMGNYMNRGHIRISKATGFRIHFLAEMDLTKTSDNKLTFLHILARAVITKFPDVVTFPSEITDVKAASRVLYPAVVQELQEQRKIWLHIRDHLHETAPKTKHDKFKIAMETCLVRTNGSLKRLEQLQNSTVKEFHKSAKYFGENPKNIGMQQFFKIFDEFTNKFERSYHEVRKFVKTRSPHR